MALLGTLQVRMGLDTSVFSDKFNAFTKDMEKRAKGFSRGLQGLTNFGSLAGGLGIGAALTQGLSAAGDFESSIMQVAAASDLGANAIKGLGDIAIQATKGTVFGANQAAAAMLELAKAGMSPAEQEAGGLAATMQLAATEGIELGRAATIITEAMGAFKLQAGFAAGIADALAGASIASTASVDGLALGLSQVSAVAHLSGLSINETAGSLALLAQNGIKGSDAGTSLKTMLLRLSAPTDEAKNLMNGLGISFRNTDGTMKSVSEAAGILQKGLAALTEEQKASFLQTVFGTDAYRSAAVFAAAGAEGVQKYVDATLDKNAAEKLSEARTQGFAGAMAKLRHTFETVAIEISRGGILDAFTSLAEKGAAMVGKLATLPDWAKKLGVGLAIGAAILPPLALAVSSVSLAFPALLTGISAVAGFLVSPFGLAIGGAITAAVLFKTELIAAWGELQTWFSTWVQNNRSRLDGLKQAWSGLVTSLGPLWTAIKEGLLLMGKGLAAVFGPSVAAQITGFGSLVGTVMSGLLDYVTQYVQGVTAVLNWFTQGVPALTEKIVGFVNGLGPRLAAAWQWLKDSAKGIWDGIGETMTSAWNGMKESLSGIWEGIKAKFREWANSLGEVFDSAWEAMKPKFAAVWDKLKDWFTSTALPELRAAIETAWRATDWSFLGVAVSDGLRAGIRSGKNAAIAEVVSMAAGLISGGKNKLESHSPSRVFIRLGEDVGNGFVIGIRNKIAEVGKAVQQLVSSGPGSFGSSFLASATRNVVGPDADKQFKAWTESISKGAIQVQSAWSSAMSHVGSAIDEFVKTGKLNFSDLVRSIIADLASAALKNAFNGLLQGILGATGGLFGGSTGSSGGGILSGLGSIFGGLFGGMASFEGGGYTGTGSRSGGLDGRGGRLALLHPRETVIDHAAIKRDARGSQRPQVQLSVPITLMPGVSKEELGAILPMLKRDIIETIPALITRGGRYASAFGQ